MSDDTKDKHLTIGDLQMMMDSYQNMFLMHKTVLDQQSAMSDMLKEIIKKQEAISGKQMSTCTNLQSVTLKLDDCLNSLGKTTDSLNHFEDKMRDKVEDIKTTVKDHDKESVTSHEKITNKIHLAWIGSGTVILGMLTIVWKIFFGG